jgi:hypothetical protein
MNLCWEQATLQKTSFSQGRFQSILDKPQMQCYDQRQIDEWQQAVRKGREDLDTMNVQAPIQRRDE